MRDSIRTSLSVIFPKFGEVFLNGDILEVNYAKDFFQASKGDTIMALADRWVIITNLPYDTTYKIFRELEKTGVQIHSMNWRFRIIGENEERKYVLAELIEAEFRGVFSRTITRESIDYDSGKEYVNIYGLRIGVTKGERVRVKEDGTLRAILTPENFKMNEHVITTELIDKTEITAIDWKITNENGFLGRLMKSAIEKQESENFTGGRICGYDHTQGVYIDLRFDENLTMSGDVIKVDPISEEDLRKLSYFYTIKIPVAYISIYNDTRINIKEAFYKGKKEKIVDSEFFGKSFELRRHRYSISSYAKRKLPRGYNDNGLRDYVGNLREFVKAVKEALNAVKSINSQTKGVNKLEEFLEKVYVNTPTKKVEIIKKWIEVFEKVKDLTPKATLYIIFYGQRNKFDRYSSPKYVGFRVDKDGKISILSNRIVPISGIVLKGGEFEKRYREAYKIDRLIKYQAMPKEKKITTLMSDVEKVRNELKSLDVEPSTSPYKIVESKLRDLAIQKELTDNVVWVFLKYAFEKEEDLRRFVKSGLGDRIREARKLIIGLIKTGTPEDFIRLSEKILPAIRTAIKYELKLRGYSQRKGVMFLGNPETVWMKILEALKNIRGRLLALVIETERPNVDVKVKTRLSKRIDALLDQIS